jgi:hypothetical protein
MDSSQDLRMSPRGGGVTCSRVREQAEEDYDARDALAGARVGNAVGRWC